MASSSSLDPDNFPDQDRKRRLPKGHDTRSLGPSDSSDSGSDMAGPGLIDDDLLKLERGTNDDTQAGRANSTDSGASTGDDGMDDNSDRYGTGERMAAGKESSARSDGDLNTDRIVGAEEAGLGGGLDQAEEARLGITDEELLRAAEDSPDPFRKTKKTGTKKLGKKRSG